MKTRLCPSSDFATSVSAIIGRVLISSVHICQGALDLDKWNMNQHKVNFEKRP